MERREFLLVGAVAGAAMIGAGFVAGNVAVQARPRRFVYDTFTDSPAVALASHVSDSGANWTRSAVNALGTTVVSNANRIRGTSAGSALALHYASTASRNANYFVEGTLYVASLLTGTYAGVAARVNASNFDFYWAIYNVTAGAWQLWKSPSGTGAQLGSDVAQTLAVGQSYRVGLHVFGSTIRLFVDGVQKIVVSDSTITEAGRPGVVTYGVTTDTTGLHVDIFSSDSVFKQVVCDGDSITQGFGLTFGTAYPAQLGALQGSTWGFRNLGIGGQTLAQMQSARSDVDVTFSAANSRNIVLCGGGTNDFYFNATLAAVQTSLQAYCASCRAAGFSVMPVTLLPRGDFPGTSTLPADKKTNHEALRIAYNAWLRANYTTFADGIVDWAASAAMGANGAENDLTYFQADKVHPNSTGASVLAGIANTAVTGL